MKSTNDIWEELGALPVDEVMHVMTKLFATYEEQLQKDPKNEAAQGFFRNLANAIEQTSQCNLNRR